MKRNIIILAAFALISAGFTSCNQKIKEKNVALTTDLDSLSYAFGLENAESFKYSRGYDPEMVNADWVDGFLNGMYSEKASENYISGQQAGINYKKWLDGQAKHPFPNDTVSKINKDAFVDAMVSALLNQKNGKMTFEEAENFTNTFFEKAARKMHPEAAEAEEKFLAENKTKENVEVTPSGLQYKIITQGTGETPGERTSVKVNYTGTFIDGTKFDSSIDRGEPLEFNTSGGVIPAWQEAVKMMPVGSKWIIYAPSNLAYGYTGYGNIPPFTPLIFEIELLEIVK